MYGLVWVISAFKAVGISSACEMRVGCVWPHSLATIPVSGARFTRDKPKWLSMAERVAAQPGLNSTSFTITHRRSEIALQTLAISVLVHQILISLA
jgi:hypothetical protein